MPADKKVWDKHWSGRRWRGSGSGSSLFERVSSFYRRNFIARQVRTYTDRYFPREGFFLECGSGTSESSSRIPRRGRRLFCAVDFSYKALSMAKKERSEKGTRMDFFVQADNFNLPFKDESVDGIWNVGVREHFGEDELVEILAEFKRVLKKNRCCVLFWLWVLAPSHLLFSSYEKIQGWRGIDKKLFPDSPSMFKRWGSSGGSSRVVRRLEEMRFAEIKFHPPLFDLTHWAVVLRK